MVAVNDGMEDVCTETALPWALGVGKALSHEPAGELIPLSEKVKSVLYLAS